MSIEKALKAEFANEIEKLKKENQEVHDAVIRKHKELMAIRMSLSTEVCPSCEGEQTIEWNVADKGYKAFCPECGNRLMLCSDCLMEEDICNYDLEEDICYRVIEHMWCELEDVPMDTDTDGKEYIPEAFILSGWTFPEGMGKMELWSWFNERHPRGIS